ncbi:MAG: hypothetical protein Ct9H300mP13_2500 [Gammaproteobacteria bacterium]|nr:MAG: hypothetical protein Ct9H300mP13_2500 [Gammaproteobacteria bacterium]
MGSPDQVVLVEGKEEELGRIHLPGFDERKEPLEEFPLDSVTFVGGLVALGETRGSFLQGTGRRRS